MNNNKKHQFSIVDLSLVDHGLEHLEAIIVAYVIGWEKSTGKCCAGIPYIAEDLRLSERSVRRYIKRLIALGFLFEKVTGRSRQLYTNAAKLAGVDGLIVAKMATQTGQNGRELRPNWPPINNNINNTIKNSKTDLHQPDTNSKPTKSELVWSQEKNAMVRVRYRTD